MTDDNDQAPDANRAPGQKTPSRSYGRQVHSDAEADDSTPASTAASSPQGGEKAKQSGTSSTNDQ